MLKIVHRLRSRAERQVWPGRGTLTPIRYFQQSRAEISFLWRRRALAPTPPRPAGQGLALLFLRTAVPLLIIRPGAGDAAWSPERGARLAAGAPEDSELFFCFFLLAVLSRPFVGSPGAPAGADVEGPGGWMEMISPTGAGGTLSFRAILSCSWAWVPFAWLPRAWATLACWTVASTGPREGLDPGDGRAGPFDLAATDSFFTSLRACLEPVRRGAAGDLVLVVFFEPVLEAFFLASFWGLFARRRSRRR